MLFGEGTSTEEAHRLLSAAEDCGINFFDSAEMYPVPQSAATQGASERILGAWLRKRRRCELLCAVSADMLSIVLYQHYICTVPHAHSH